MNNLDRSYTRYVRPVGNYEQLRAQNSNWYRSHVHQAVHAARERLIWNNHNQRHLWLA